MPSFLTFLLGLAGLIIGASLLIRGGSALAFRAGVSPFIVGITLVAIGTSSPELAIAVKSSLAGEGTLSIGNVIGANIISLLLILGLIAIIRPVRIPSQGLMLHLPMMVLSGGLLFLLLIDGELNILDGLILLAMTATYLILVAAALRRGRVSSQPTATDPDDVQPEPDPVLPSLLRLVSGLVVLILGSEFAVSAAVEIATSLGLSNSLIGLTVVALGTTAPELTTALMASIRHERQLALGNIFGNVVFNNSLILGVVGSLSASPVLIDQTTTRVDLPVLLFASIICVPILLSGKRIVRAEGTAMVICYLAFLMFLILVQAQQ